MITRIQIQLQSSKILLKHTIFHLSLLALVYTMPKHARVSQCWDNNLKGRGYTVAGYRNERTQKFDVRQTSAGRRKSKKKKINKNALMMYWAFVLGVSMLLSAFIIVAANEVFAFKKPDYTAVVEIPENAGTYQVARILKKADIINHPMLFSFFVGLTTDDVKFIAGKHEPNAALDYRALLRTLTRKSTYKETVRVTIPEGYNIKQIVDLMVENGVCEKQAIEDVLKGHDFEETILENLKTGELNRLEGYLFPDTYEFYVGDDPVRVVNKLISNFKNKFTNAMVSRAGELNMTVHEVITLASIIEKEATAADREKISSVFHNRLDSKSYPYLESCATVQYALGTNKKVLTIEDTKVKSPYNTYENKGLPPGPIASPGIEAIEAALYPADTDYLFFALQENGTHKFSKTYAEHQKVPNLNP